MKVLPLNNERHKRWFSKAMIAAIMAGFIFLFSAQPAGADDVPQTFTLDGQLFGDVAGTTPLVDSAVQMKVQILDEDRVCILYEETQSVNTIFSKGYFSVQVGSSTGAVKRSGTDSGNAMATVFQNIANVSGKKVSDGTACTITATGGKRRYVRITISPSTMGSTARVLSPDLTVDSVPNAVVAERAESLQGLRSTDVLKVNVAAGSALSQANLESLFTTTTRFNSLSALVSGTSTDYMRTNAGGAQLPVFTGAPTSPVQGSMWFDTSDQKLKYRTGSGTTEILSTSTTSGSVTSVGLTAPSELSVTGAPVTSTGTIALSWANQTTNKVFAAPDGSTGAPSFRALTANDIPSLAWSKLSSVTAGGDLSGTYPNPSVAKLQGVAVSASSPSAGQVLKLVSSTWTPSNFSIGDLLTATGTQQFSGASCTAKQTLTWSALTDTFTCTDIAGLDAAAITTGTINAARLPAGTASQWTTTGSDIYYTTGKVGVGTTSPSYGLHVKKDTFMFETAGGSPYLYAAGSGNLAIGTNSSAANKLDVGGAVAIGYVGTTAPSNGLIVSGNVGVATTSPRAALDVSGTILNAAAVVNSSSTIDASTGNTQYTGANCGAFQFNNMKDGGSYMFVVKGTTSATCSFTAYTGAGTGALTVHMPPDHAATTAAKHTIYNLTVVGSDVYVAWTPGY